MNAIKIFSISFLTLGVILFLSPKQAPTETDSKKLPPAPSGTEIRFSEESEEKEQEEFLRWYENMHRAAPGVNWREIDQQNRLRNYQLRNTEMVNKTMVEDTLANGNLIGEWRERGSANQSGRIHTAFMDTVNNKIYAGSSGGNIWKGNPGGSGWASLNDNLQFDGISLIKQIPHGAGTRLLVGTTSTHFWFSDDDGNTWSEATGLGGPQAWGWIPRTVVVEDSRHTIFLLAVEWDFTNWNAETSIYRSTDHGTSFSKIIAWGEPAEGNSDRFDIFSPLMGDSSTFLLHSGKVFSMNYTTGMPDSIGSIALNADGRTLLAGQHITGTTRLFAYVDQDIYKSTDGGISWNFIADCGMNPFFRTSFSASLTQPDYLWFGDVDCHRSTDGGQTWNTVNSWVDYYGNPANKLHADIPGVFPFIDAGGAEKQFIGTDGGLYISGNQVGTVSNLSLNGLNVSQYYSTYTHRVDPGYIYVGTQDQGFQRSNDDPGGIINFNQVISGDYGHLVSSDGGNSLWMVYPGFADYYPYAPNGNSVSNWNFQNIPLWIPPMLAHPVDAWKCYLAGGFLTTSGSHILQLEYTGSMVATERPFDFEAASGGGIITAMEYSRPDTNHWYVATDNGKFFHSSDGGITYDSTDNFGGPGAHYFYGNDIYASRMNPGTVYVAGSGYSNPAFYKSTNHGQTFVPAVSGFPSTLIFGITANADESLIFAATEVGPYVYVVAENQWYNMSGSNAPDQTYWSVDYIPSINTVRFGTYGRGIWDFAITYPVVASVELPTHNDAVRLWPNPADDYVNLLLSAPSLNEVQVNFYSVDGTLQKSSRQFPGQSNGYLRMETASLPEGMMLVEMKGRNFSAVKKLVISH